MQTGAGIAEVHIVRLMLFLLLFLVAATAHAAPVRVFIAGDSTAAEYGPERAPQQELEPQTARRLQAQPGACAGRPPTARQTVTKAGQCDSCDSSRRVRDRV